MLTFENVAPPGWKLLPPDGPYRVWYNEKLGRYAAVDAFLPSPEQLVRVRAEMFEGGPPQTVTTTREISED